MSFRQLLPAEFDIRMSFRQLAMQPLRRVSQMRQKVFCGKPPKK